MAEQVCRCPYPLRAPHEAEEGNSGKLFLMCGHCGQPIQMMVGFAGWLHAKNTHVEVGGNRVCCTSTRKTGSPQPGQVALQVRIDEWTVTEARKMAERQGTSLKAVVESALNEYIQSRQPGR